MKATGQSQYGVGGAPTFIIGSQTVVIGSQTVVGAHPFATSDAILKSLTQ